MKMNTNELKSKMNSHLIFSGLAASLHAILSYNSDILHDRSTYSELFNQQLTCFCLINS